VEFIAAVQACIDAHTMLYSGATVLVAVSGGPDSMALLAVLYRLRSLYHPLTLRVVHINHHLRGAESTRDAVFVEQQAARLGLSFHIQHIDVKTWQHTSGLSPQHAAREARYTSLYALQRALNATHIALGHSADDQAETLLMRLLRGSGPAGIAGIPPVRLPYIRPLLTVFRHDILTYLQAEGVPWIEDSSNLHLSYLRNRIRLELLPLLRQYNPCVASRLNDLAVMCSAEHSLLDQQTQQAAEQIIHWQPGKRVLIRCAPYEAIPLALQRRLLRRVADGLLPAPTPISFHHIESLRRLILQGRVGQRHSLPGGWMAERHQETTQLWHPQLLPAATLERVLSVPGHIDIPELEMRVSAEIHASCGRLPRGVGACLDLRQLCLPLTVRFRQPGDRFYPSGAPGWRKLKDFFIDQKVPRAERDMVPLVLSGVDIVWVVGYRIAEPYKVRPDTCDVVQLHCTMMRTSEG
jgi:tRNA(Ile)-lysidine synthase